MASPSVLEDDDRAANAVSADRPGAGAPVAYDRDYMLWLQTQAHALRDKRWSALDVANLADEVESLGKSERRAIRSRLMVLLQHLLKWRHQPAGRSMSWRAAIVEQRAGLAADLADSPSLRAYPAEILADQYRIARLKAAGETGLSLGRFPETCPFTADAVLDAEYYPEAVE